MCVPWNVIGPVWDARRPIVIDSSGALKAAKGNTKRTTKKMSRRVPDLFHTDSFLYFVIIWIRYTPFLSVVK